MDTSRPARPAEPSNFGVLLHVHRVAAGFSQAELAERAGLSARAISDLERGARRCPYPTTVRHLARALRLGKPERLALLAAREAAGNSVVPSPELEPGAIPAHTAGGEATVVGISSRLARRPSTTKRDAPAEVSRRAIGEQLGHVGTTIRARRPPQEPLVGRHLELARVLETLEGVAATGVGRMVLVSGEPGVGKTRLGHEVLQRAGTMDVRACLGRSFEQHTSVPFFPFSEALTLPLAGPPLLPEAEAIQRWPELALLLPESTDEQLRQDSGENQLQVFRAVTAFLRAVSEQSPLVLLLDDLHWADATSMSLLLYLGRHLTGARVLIMGTYRNIDVSRQSPLAETVTELLRERLAEEVTLRRLSLNESAELLRAQLGSAQVSDELVVLVHDRADGNPFFSEELIKALIEQGAVSQIGGVWASGPEIEIDVPRSIRSVVNQRVRRLAPEVQDLLHLGSVVGQEFDLDVMLAASGQEESVFLGELDAALASGLLNEESGRNLEGYRFAHALIQQTLYNELPGYRRRRLHQQVAEALQSTSPQRPVLAAELSRHFLAAGDRERALSYTIEAGDQAASQYAHAEAASHFQVALDELVKIGDSARVADVQYRLARELYDLNRTDEALRAYEAALGGYETVGNAMGQALVHRGIGLLHDGRYDMAGAVSHFNAALRLWPPDPDDATLGWLLMEASRASFYSGDPTAGLALAERSLALAERCGDPGLLARALGRVANNRIIQDPRPTTALRLFDRAERIARSSNDWRALSRVYLGRADQHSAAGDWDLGLADRRHAIESAERSGETERLMFAYENVAETCMILGNWHDGRNAARAALALDPQGYFTGTYTHQQLAWMQGNPDEALRLVRAHVADARQRADVQGVALNLVWLADFALQLERPEEAEAPAREAAEFLRVGGRWQPWPGIFCGVLAETVVMVGAPDAEDVVAAAEEMVATTEQFAARPQLSRARGLLLQREGDLRKSVEAFLASAEIARSQKTWVQLGRTLDALIPIAQQRGDAKLAAQAQAELEELVHRIGPEVGVLAWACRVATATGSTSVQGGRSATGELAKLTPREREVAVLVARGLTNHQIAEALVIADGTAGVHVDHILNKLGFRSRAQVAAWAVEHGLIVAPTH